MELTLWQIVTLAIVQGIAEFLPISSSGHLVILAAIMTGGNTAALDIADLNVVLHVGTLLSIVVFYWQRILSLLAEDRRTVVLLAIGTIPAVAIGLPVEIFFEEILESPLIAGSMLLVTGSLLLIIQRCSEGTEEYTGMSLRKAGIIGMAQAVAILPGISRSGSTICAGLKLGLTRESAATFSFLLAIPVIGGAGLLKTKDLIGDSGSLTTPASYLLVGTLISFVVGLFALNWLLKWLKSGKLFYFAYWCIPAGLCVVAWEILR